MREDEHKTLQQSEDESQTDSLLGENELNSQDPDQNASLSVCYADGTTLFEDIGAFL